jgi:hypothetical protein
MKKLILLGLLAAGLVPAADFTWTPIPYNPGVLADWGSPFQTGQYEIDNHGRIFLRGMVTCPNGFISAGELLFTLPVGFRPLSYIIINAAYDNSSTIGLQIGPDGTVVSRSNLNCNNEVDFFSFDGVNFSTK